VTKSINPFHLPDSLRTQPLCPWEHTSHHDFYVDVDNAKQAFDEFVQAMGDLALFLNHGRLVLVTGESGCGKTALVNRCVHWMVRELAARDLKAEVIDLTRSLLGRPALSVEDRVGAVCDELFGELRDRDALKRDAAKELEPDRNQPHRIYPRMPVALVDGRVLIILLPTPDELKNEVLRYGGLARGKMLFLAESALLDDHDVEDVLRAQRDWVPPITLSVGALRPGDVRRFVSDRLGRHSDQGSYPRMEEEAMDSLASLLRSVAQLQHILSRTYDARRASDLPYDEDCYVTEDEVRRQRMSWLGGVP
jgi:energy-coupling factor transporter ATP-binding protein EcfA2